MPTRFYFSGSQIPSVSPAFGAWDSATTRLKMLGDKEVSEALTSIGLGGVSELVCVAQFVSEPLVAQAISGTVKAYLRAVAESDPTVTPRLLVKVVSGDGSTIRGTLLAIANYGSGATFSTVALTNCAWANGDAVSLVNALDGDRLVVEIGISNALSADGFVDFGAPSGTSDLPENETETGNLVPWIEFSGTITLQASGAENLLLMGVG